MASIEKTKMFKAFLLLFVVTNASFRSINTVEIEKIEFASKGCFGKCPVWKLTIENETEGYLIAEKFNKLNGSFVAKIDEDEIAKIKSLIRELESITLKEYYNDGPTCGIITEIKIASKEKIVSTRMMRFSGPKQVQNLFAAIIDLKEKTAWQEVAFQ